mmetsp:Transcript_430/g.640  ORF Transcript_430/g.640 Transcript_430/m.640 type:complete len:333 (+) Transcript_430:78-1076(+)
MLPEAMTMRVFLLILLLTYAVVCLVLNLSFFFSSTELEESKDSTSQSCSGLSPSIDQFWIGDVASPISNDQPIALFLNYCQGDLAWLSTFLIGHSMSNITIVSKCGNPIPLGRKMLKRVNTLQLPNVGRNDHTIAHTMSMISKQPKLFENHIIVFLKDNLKIHQQAQSRSLTSMLGVASVNGFGCYLKPRGGASQFHRTDVLGTFNLTLYRPKVQTNDNSNFKSEFANMGGWLDKIGVSLPSPFTSVCYGGSFAVKASRIAAVSSTTWNAIETSLSRADNIEEGHFAERTWSGLLSPPPTGAQNKILDERTTSINYKLSKDGGGQLGALLLD